MYRVVTVTVDDQAVLQTVLPGPVRFIAACAVMIRNRRIDTD